MQWVHAATQRANDSGVPAKALPMACMTERREGKQLTEMYDLQQAGAVAFTDDAPIDRPGMLQRALTYAQTHGLTPLLAHCERYPYLHKNEALLDLWRERGGWMSVNAASLVGAYGNEVKDMAHRCMTQGWVSFVCSDAHGMRHVRALESLSHSRHVAQWMEEGHCLHAGLG